MQKTCNHYNIIYYYMARYVSQFQKVLQSTSYSVITDIAGSGSKMYYRCSSRTNCSKSVNVGHHIMPSLFLLLTSILKVYIWHICLHLIDLFVRNIQPQCLKLKTIKSSLVYSIAAFTFSTLYSKCPTRMINIKSTHTSFYQSAKQNTTITPCFTYYHSFNAT